MSNSVAAPVSSTKAARAIPAIIPQPTRLESSTGFFPITSKTQIVADRASLKTAEQLRDYLAPAMGFTLQIVSESTSIALNTVVLREDPTLNDLRKEGYDLQITENSITARAPTQTGLFYAVQTLRQLLPPQIFSNQKSEMSWTIPCANIQDQPRFAWRGLMLDSGHDFQRLPFVLRFIDLMAQHKFNVLHWHLTDMGTWAIEIKKYPQLLDPKTRVEGVKPGHYTQDEIKKVIQYAADRHITIVPEVDMPGHATPALTAFPELDCGIEYRPASPDRRRPWEARAWEYCVGNEKTYAFLENVLSEVIELFPSKYIHIGGDESPKGRWAQCPKCQAMKKAHGLKDEDELQSYFIRRIEKFLNSRGKNLVGWDEILEGGLAPNASVMVWRGDGIKAATEAAKAGHDVIMAPNNNTYFDYFQSEDKKSDPQGAHGVTPLSKVYEFEPIPPDFSAADAKHILGAQGQMWTDTHPREESIDWLLWPRACALSEVAWSEKSSRNYENFFARMKIHEQRLKAQNVNARPLSSIR